MKIIKNKILPFGNKYIAIYLFGLLFTKRDYLSNEVIRHELIHEKQMLELGIIPFYIWYVLNYALNLLKYKDTKFAYENIIFEKEAYNLSKYSNYLSFRFRYSFLLTKYLFVCKYNLFDMKLYYLDKSNNWTDNIWKAKKYRNVDKIDKKYYNYIVDFESIISKINQTRIIVSN